MATECDECKASAGERCHPDCPNLPDKQEEAEEGRIIYDVVDDRYYYDENREEQGHG